MSTYQTEHKVLYFLVVFLIIGLSILKVFKMVSPTEFWAIAALILIIDGRLIFIKIKRKREIRKTVQEYLEKDLPQENE
jgi:hypothetical protein